MLTLTGLTGVGKTSLIHFIFRYIRSVVPELSEYVPVIVDLRQGWNRVDERDLFQQIRRSGQSACEDYFERGKSRGFFDRYAKRFSSDNLLVARREFEIFCNIWVNMAQENGCKLVVIFDNLDQLTPQSVTRVLNLARILALKYQIRIVVAMRPFAFWTEIEREVDRGTFARAGLTVRPPDLGQIISQRLNLALEIDEKAPTSVLFSTAGRLPIELSDIKETFDRLAEFFIRPEIQHTISCDLCRYDIRRAFEAVKGFLRYSDLAIGYFADYLIVPDTIRRGPAFHPAKQLIQGIMNEDRHYYLERRSNESRNHIIMNLFSSGLSGIGREITIQYRILTLLAWKSEMVSCEWCKNLMLKLGFSYDHFHHAVRRLLQFGLVISPQTESDFHSIRDLKISSSGRYYLSYLVSHHDYLYNVIMDTPLLHDSWQKHAEFFGTSSVGKFNDFAIRVDSIMELIIHVVDAEYQELNEMSKSERPWFPSVIESASLMCTRLFEATKIIIEGGLASKFRGVRRAARERKKLLETEIKKEIDQTEDLLHNMVRVEKKNRNVKTEVYSYSLGDDVGVTELTVSESKRKGSVASFELALKPSAFWDCQPIGAFIDFENAEPRKGEKPYACLGSDFYGIKSYEGEPGKIEKCYMNVLVTKYDGKPIGGKVFYTKNGSLLGIQEFPH